MIETLSPTWIEPQQISPVVALKDAHRELVALLHRYVDTRNDINEHLYTLCDYAKRCSAVAELGVARGYSTAALAAGLAASESLVPTLFCVDIYDCANVEALTVARRAGISCRFVQANSATVTIPEVDLLFIDTWHCYGHLKRELTRHHGSVRQWIIMHDTTIDGYIGESVRRGDDLIALRQATGYSIDEMYCGLGMAIQEFLMTNPAWCIERIFHNNNGLTVLRRIGDGFAVGGACGRG